MRRSLLVVLALALVSIAAWATNTLDVYFIDVGQGDAILVDYGENELLIDGGPDGSCVPFLRQHVEGPLEMVVATHPHSDHIGGLDDVLRAFDVLQVVTNGTLANTTSFANFDAAVKAERCTVTVAERNNILEFGDLSVVVLHPHEISGDANDDSVVLRMTFGDVDFLFTGDIGEDAEEELLRMGCLSDIDILKVAHHGSRYSSSTDFLNAILPELAVYSAGVGNSYGHPAQETLQRLATAGAIVSGTDTCGTIHVSCTPTGYSVVSEYTSQTLQALSSRESHILDQSIMITEVEVNPSGSDSGAEWIELYNPTSAPVSLLGWTASYTGYGGGWDRIPSVTIGPGEYYLFIYPKQHLENTRGEIIRVRDADGILIDQTPSGLVDDRDDPRTWQRIPDGPNQGDWVYQLETPGSAAV